jgi:Mitochondrial small ribosomal subunit Rsm22
MTAISRWQLVEDALHAAAGPLAEKAARLPHWFADAVVDRSRRYTSEREAIHKAPDREADLAARALFFSPVDAAKIAAPLAELVRARGGELLGAPGAAGSVGAAGAAGAAVRVVDLGAGCGAMSLGLLATVGALAPRWEITLVDRDAPALAIARGALERLAAVLALDVAVKVVAQELSSWKPVPCELVLAGTVLNELPVPASRALVAAALASIKGARGDGAVLLLEPALRDASRRLHELRDEQLAANTSSVIAPCVRKGAPCPMLERPTDWCHEDRPFHPTERVGHVADVTRLRDGNLKYAYLVLALRPAPLLPPRPGHTALRIVSGVLPGGKGKREQWGCGDVGRISVRRLDRRASETNAWFDELRRGDLLEAPSERVAAAVTSRLEILEDDGLPVTRVGDQSR